jgi:hypothetical protein
VYQYQYQYQNQYYPRTKMQFQGLGVKSGQFGQVEFHLPTPHNIGKDADLNQSYKSVSTFK